LENVKQETLIRERAYAIWEEEGRPGGREWDHWERASYEILARIGVVEEMRLPKPKARKTVKSRIRSALKAARV
jgi:hypothetical protein